MSLITFDFSEDSALGVGVASGMVTCYPARRRVSGSTIVLRKPFIVNLVNGVGSVDLAPNVPGTAWMITVSPTSNNDQYSGYYVVPQSDSNFKDLIEVDPDTLEVDVEPEPAWWAMARSTVSNGTVNSDGDLILDRADGTSVNAGHVVGDPGTPGAPGAPGTPGTPGRNGVGFSSAELTPDGDLNLIRDTGETINVGHVVGSDGVDGVSPFEIPGAFGDGINDDSTAIQNWLDAGNSVISNGTYLIASTINVTNDDAQVMTINAKLVAATAEMEMFNVTGNNVRMTVNLDGMEIARYGIRCSGKTPNFHYCNIVNIYSYNHSPRGIEVTNPDGGEVSNCVIENVYSDTNYSRAITLHHTYPTVHQFKITDNRIRRIFGLEGDAIASLGSDASGVVPYLSVPVLVSGNQISSVSRRFIKIQSSDAVVINNYLTHDYSETFTLNASNAIDFILCERGTVMNNVIDRVPINGSISIAGSATAVLPGFVVSGNESIRNVDTTSTQIYLNYTDNAVVQSNVLRGGGGPGIVCGFSTNPSIEGNKFYGGIAGQDVIRSTTSSTRMVARNNLVFTPGRNIVNGSTNGVTEINWMAV